MDASTLTISLKDKIVSFLWQHVLLAASLFVMTLGVALCVRSQLGSSVISTIPFVMALAGDTGRVPALTIGQYTYIMNAVFVFMQILILRRRFKPVQLFQLIIGFLFGYLLDVNMSLTAVLPSDTQLYRIILQFAGCLVLAVGIAFEIRCGSVTMPGEGITIAFSVVTKMPFAKSKIIIDSSLVVIAVALGYCFFGTWLANVVGSGTLFAMIFVGAAVKFINPHLEWFDHVLAYRPGIRRYVFGLARFIFKR